MLKNNSQAVKEAWRLNLVAAASAAEEEES